MNRPIAPRVAALTRCRYLGRNDPLVAYGTQGFLLYGWFAECPTMRIRFDTDVEMQAQVVDLEIIPGEGKP